MVAQTDIPSRSIGQTVAHYDFELLQYIEPKEQLVSIAVTYVSVGS